jgi:hypothetical protein
MTKTPEKPSPDAVDPADAATPAPESAQADSAKADSGATETHATETDAKAAPKEIGGRGGPDPTRYGDWEKAGRCVDF